MDAVAVGVLVAVLAIGAGISRRWGAVALPLLVWPLYFAGLTQAWWGYGVGDGWKFGAAIVMLVSVITTIAGVAVGRWLTRTTKV